MIKIFNKFNILTILAACFFLSLNANATSETKFTEKNSPTENLIASDELKLDLDLDNFYYGGGYRRPYCAIYADHPTCGYGISSLGYAYPWYKRYYPTQYWAYPYRGFGFKRGPYFKSRKKK